MPLSTAERQKRYRDKIKEDATKLLEYKLKKHEFYINSRNPIASQSRRAKRMTRRRWKCNQQSHRLKKKETINLFQKPYSPESSSSDEGHQQSSFVETPSTSTSITSCNNKQSRKLSIGAVRQRYVRRLQQAYNANDQLKRKIRSIQRKMLRLQSKVGKTVSKSTSPKTPRSKANQLLKASPSKIRKTLVFHCALVDELKESKKKCQSVRDKQILSRVLHGRILKKYRLLRRVKHEVGLKCREVQQTKFRTSGLTYIPKKYSRFKSDNIESEIVAFFIEDVNSRASAGKNETITRNKVKKQKRYLNDSIKNLHRKFCEDKVPVSYSAFRKLKPFWVVRMEERDTCACKKCENLKLKISALHRLGEVSTVNVADCLKQINCSIDNQLCMYRKCSTCASKSVAFAHRTPDDSTISWWAWTCKTEERVRRQANGQEVKYTVRVTLKQKQIGKCIDLQEAFSEELKQYCVHKYNIIHQYNELKKLRANLKENECAIIVDFSENYSTKYACEIQSVHFGASRTQVTLHTGVYYTSHDKQSFCTVSADNRHDPAAIWAHLKPILTQIKCQFEKVTTIHFISDSPSTQYRSVKNLYLMKTVMHDEYGFARVTWNFTEAGHGKGPADGVGALIKRTADEIVNAGTDITDASTLYHCLKNKTAVDLYMISEENMHQIDSIVPTPDSLKAFKIDGIMKIHQVRSTNGESSLEHRVLSCFCSDDCGCFGPKIIWSGKDMYETEKRLFDKLDTRDLPAAKKTEGRSRIPNCCGGKSVHKSNATCTTIDLPSKIDQPARKTRHATACRKNTNTFQIPGTVLPSRTKPTGLKNVNRLSKATPEKPCTEKRNAQRKPKQKVKRQAMKTTKHARLQSTLSTPSRQSTYRKPIWLEERQRLSVTKEVPVEMTSTMQDCRRSQRQKFIPARYLDNNSYTMSELFVVES